jgi:molybdopterin biosynthesis enzyme MoaB
MTAPVRIGVVTISDRASRGVYEDRGGPAIRDCLAELRAKKAFVVTDRTLIDAGVWEPVRVSSPTIGPPSSRR